MYLCSPQPALTVRDQLQLGLTLGKVAHTTIMRMRHSITCQLASSFGAVPPLWSWLQATKIQLGLTVFASFLINKCLKFLRNNIHCPLLNVSRIFFLETLLDFFLSTTRCYILNASSELSLIPAVMFLIEHCTRRP